MYSEFKQFLDNKKILIMCKGNFVTPIKKNYDIYIGVKQSIAILPQKDVLVMNDFEGVFGLEDYFKEIKYIVFPNVPHLRQKPSIIAKNKLLKYLSLHNFNGKIINYEILSNNNPNPKMEIIRNTRNSGDIIYHFLNMCKNIIFVDVYGMYSSIDDNKDITNVVLNAKIHPEYKEYYDSYIYRVYKNKPDGNKKMITAATNLDKKDAKNINEMFQHLQNKLKQSYPKLNLNFVN